MIKLKDLLEKKFNEIDFKSQKAFAKYNAKHKMRKSTKVNIGGKETTAGDADKKTKKKKEPWDDYVKGGHIEDPNKAAADDVGGPAHPNVPKGAKSSKDVKKDQWDEYEKNK